ncbi:MAG: hypothetical protein ACRD2W_11350 [Acidimicrobiales bacterium]
MSAWAAPWPEPDVGPPPGGLAELPAAPLRQVVASYIAHDGATVGEAARAIGLEPDYVLGVMSGTVIAVDARTVRTLSDRLDLVPEDIWGGELGAAIGWVYGGLSPSDLELAPPLAVELPWPADPFTEPPSIEL